MKNFSLAWSYLNYGPISVMTHKLKELVDFKPFYSCLSLKLSQADFDTESRDKIIEDSLNRAFCGSVLVARNSRFIQFLGNLRKVQF